MCMVDLDAGAPELDGGFFLLEEFLLFFDCIFYK